MKTLLTLVFAGLIAVPAIAQDTDPVLEPSIFIDGRDVELSQFLWRNRPLVVFADSAEDPRFIRQMALLRDRAEELEERDVVVLTDTEPAAESALRRKLRPRGFMLAVIDKDGQVKQRKPLPWSVREISRVIDKLPMRQQEIRERREAR